MSLCVVTGDYCSCQLTEGTDCPGVVALRERVARLEGALQTLLDAASKATSKRSALAAAREKRRGDCMREEVAYAKACA